MKSRVTSFKKKHILGPYESVPTSRVRGVQGKSTNAIGSDIRQREKVFGSCILCCNTENLQLSHVHPRWAYKYMKDEGAVLSRPDSDNSIEAKDGPKHYLLCASCEQYLGEGENALARVSVESPEMLAKNNLHTVRTGANFWTISGEKRFLLQRGLLGIALKYHYAPSGLFRLPSKRLVHTLRQALRGDNYSRLSPPSAAKWYAFDELRGVNPRAMLFTSIEDYRFRAPFLRQMLGGITWITPLNSGRWPLKEADGFNWALMFGDLRINAQVFSDWEQVEPRDVFESWSKMSEEDDCACGSKKVAKYCCSGTWLPTLK